MSSVLVALRRLATDRAPAIGLGLLVLVTAILVGLAPRLLDRVSDDALHGVVAEAPAIGRNIALLEETGLPFTPGDPLKEVDAEGDRLDRQIPASIRAVIDHRQTVFDSARFQVRAPTKDPTFIRFRVQPGAIERVTFTEGRAPTGQVTMVDLPDELRSIIRPGDADATEPIQVDLLETAIVVDGSVQSGLKVGDRIFLAADPTDILSARNPAVIAVVITGLFTATDPADPFWYDDQSLNQVFIRGQAGTDARNLDIGGLLATDAYEGIADTSAGDGLLVRYTWRHFVDPARIASTRLDSLIVDLRRLEVAFPQTQPGVRAANQAGAGMRSGLLPLLVSHTSRWASATSILTVVAIGPAAVAFAALGLVATIVARRRRPAIALVRGRGATLGQIIRAVFLEGCVIAIPALGAAVLLSIALLPVGSNRATILGATIVAVVAILLLILTALPGTIAAARGAREDDPAPRGVSSRRLVFDIVVIVLAAGGA
jgi:putative ABC transport system permease protein